MQESPIGFLGSAVTNEEFVPNSANDTETFASAPPKVVSKVFDWSRRV